MIDQHEIDPAMLFRISGRIPMRAGVWHFTTPHTATSTANTLGNGVGRFTPWLITKPTRITALSAEITAAGDVGSVLRIGIYRDDSTGYPGELLLDAGTIPGDAVAVATVVTNITLVPGLYWVGGVVQNVTTTQPTVRTVSVDLLGVIAASTAATPPANVPVGCGYTGFGMTGALPATWPTAGTNITAQAARILAKTA